MEALRPIDGGARDTDLEVQLCMGNNLGVAGMVGGFNRHYSIADLGIMFANRVRL